jgi:hypothetical protein
MAKRTHADATHADATHAAGTSAVEAPKSLGQIFSKELNFAAIEPSGQNKGRVHLFLDFSERRLSPKRWCKAPNAGVADLRVMDDRAQIFDALACTSLSS